MNMYVEITRNLPGTYFDGVAEDVIEIVVSGVGDAELIQLRLPIRRQHLAERTLNARRGRRYQRP